MIRETETQATFKMLNFQSAFEQYREGFWRTHETDNGEKSYPWPVVMEDIPGFGPAERLKFLQVLKVKQDMAQHVSFRGMEKNKLTGKSQGMGEYHLDEWVWNSRLEEYVLHGVPPSRYFYAFIMGKECLALPTYNMFGGNG